MKFVIVIINIIILAGALCILPNVHQQIHKLSRACIHRRVLTRTEDIFASFY